ncbi:hypothetical protein FFLO_00422 [Filobasidium floriforme]|uniref:chitinase n=1 Tax=Filobasidium floriforme TaxID=5210 RepID=A0A8K0JS85_9TREE|nr:hypothetical protein FFLO_00422 [Filobasidium floriforme]
MYANQYQQQQQQQGGPPPIPQRPQQGKRSVGYFTNWSIYSPAYLPSQIPHQNLTHLNYAFANVDPHTGGVVLSDSWADVEIRHPGQGGDDGGLLGNFGVLRSLKRSNRNLKVLLSIGGWSYRDNFVPLGKDAGKREKFAKSGVRLVEDLGLDGIQIDWEYPQNSSEAHAYVDLLAKCRRELDELARSKGRSAGTYELTVAVPSGRDNYAKLDIRGMSQYVDFWNLMTSQFAGSWDSVSGHQANLYAAQPGGASVDDAVRYYIQNGIRPDQVVVGVPLYGRAFMGTHGIGQPFNGTGEGSWEQGMWDYKALPRQGAQVFEDERLGASWSFEPSNGRLVTYDTVPNIIRKANYITQQGLGGAMYWELSGDKQIPGESLIEAMARTLGGGLQYEENELNYPGSSESA